MKEGRGTFIPGFVNWLRGFHDRVDFKVQRDTSKIDTYALYLGFYGEAGVMEYTVALDGVHKYASEPGTYEPLYGEIKKFIAESLLSEYEGRVKDLGPYVDRLLGVVGAIPTKGEGGFSLPAANDYDPTTTFEHNGTQFILHDNELPPQ